MQLTNDDIEWLKSNEGCPESSHSNGIYHSYRDGGGGEWTIYYGCCFDADGCKVNRATVWTDEEANKNFIALHKKHEDKVNRLCKIDNVTLTQGQFCALVDFDFNTGSLDRSTLWKRIVNKAPIEEIEKQFLRWVYDNGKIVNGLRNRRLKEIERYKSNGSSSST